MRKRTNSHSFAECHGMSARIVYSQCLHDIINTNTFRSDLKSLFNFTISIIKDGRATGKDYPVLTHVDYYGHTAIDGWPYVNLVEAELPRLKAAAINCREYDLAALIEDFLQFIKRDPARGDHALLVFDGM